MVRLLTALQYLLAAAILGASLFGMVHTVCVHQIALAELQAETDRYVAGKTAEAVEHAVQYVMNVWHDRTDTVVEILQEQNRLLQDEPLERLERR